jgi:hypothetical protein
MRSRGRKRERSAGARSNEVKTDLATHKAALDVRKQNYQESLDWYAGITAYVFG